MRTRKPQVNGARPSKQLNWKEHVRETPEVRELIGARWAKLRLLAQDKVFLTETRKLKNTLEAPAASWGSL
jgi:hypothetical protein